MFTLVLFIFVKKKRICQIRPRRHILFIRRNSGSLDLVFDPTLAFTRFPEDLLLRYAMITAASC